MRLFIADADKELRVGLQILLHQEAGMQVIGVADKAKGLLAQVEASQPDVLLLDWHLPGMPMPELVADLQALDWSSKIIVLSVRPEDKDAAVAAGADAFFSKTGPPDELLVYLRTLKNTKHVERQV